jgi:hypothetical protein
MGISVSEKATTSFFTVDDSGHQNARNEAIGSDISKAENNNFFSDSCLVGFFVRH